ncbi:hypothetical protein [Propionicicella superfundia]|uniref:hypothetical protein n=1 Tax=Propionicicella superfundia TaxID=348582 RepID=UPI00040A8EF5|nr:hypothetical protein [Propionicicella superfundia]
MHHANHFYGHAHILARYAGLFEGGEDVWGDEPPRPPRIDGFVQHGWNLWDGYAVGTALVPGFKKFVWTRAVARRGRALGHTDHIVMGAPWVYLQSLTGRLEPRRPDSNSVIVYPFHGWEEQRLMGSHADLLADVRRVEGDVPITVCLYWDEYRDPEIRKAYVKQDVRVITHGTRGFMYKGTQPWFLDRQMTELLRHGRAVSNRMGSALLYAASLGLDVGVYGDPMAIENDHAVLGGIEKQRRLWPEMDQPFVPPADALRIAQEELGTAEMLSPAEIRYWFGWE